MSIRFAAPPQATKVRLNGWQARAAISTAANDNEGDEHAEAMLRAALRHFAEAAWFAGDRQGYRWWLGICRTLDGQMARELAAGTKDAG
jgi:hypothetical protein